MQDRETNDVEGMGSGKLVVPNDEAQQIPLSAMTGGPEGEGLLVDAGSFQEPKKGLSAVLMVVVVVVIVGGGVIWAMRTSGHPETADETVMSHESKIDEALQRFMNAQSANPKGDTADSIFKDSERYVQMFSNDPVRHQVAVDDLAKNPFELSGGKVEEGPTGPPTDYKKQEVMSRLNKEFVTLNLQSVLTGARSLAVVSGKVVREGDTIGSFRVKTIETDRVVLSAEGVDFELRIKRKEVGNG